MANLLTLRCNPFWRIQNNSSSYMTSWALGQMTEIEGPTIGRAVQRDHLQIHERSPRYLLIPRLEGEPRADMQLDDSPPGPSTFEIHQ